MGVNPQAQGKTKMLPISRFGAESLNAQQVCKSCKATQSRDCFSLLTIPETHAKTTSLCLVWEPLSISSSRNLSESFRRAKQNLLCERQEARRLNCEIRKPQNWRLTMRLAGNANFACPLLPRNFFMHISPAANKQGLQTGQGDPPVGKTN